MSYLNNPMGTRPNFDGRMKSGSEGRLVGHSPMLPVNRLGYAREAATSHRVTLVQHFPLFSNLSPRDCAEVVSKAREREYPRSHTIHLEGDPVRQVVLLTSGSAKMIQFGPNGSAVILRVYGPGELIGTLGLSTEGRHCSTAQALRHSTALVWDAIDFECMSKQYPAMRLNVAYTFSKQLGDMQDRFREISTERVASRLSRQIVRLMGQIGHRSNGTVEISISREELAQLVGTTLFTVSRLLSDWDKRGIVKTARESVSVHNVQSLQELSETVGQMPLKR
jgi:CRP/FNR family transcriptional regulator, nitrogen oxide reductase regulator